MLNNLKINKVRAIDLIWFVYLTLMMSFVFPRSQQVYTAFLFGIAIFLVIKSSRFKVSIAKYNSFFWYLIFAIYVNVSRCWSVYDYNYTGITGWVIYISMALLCLNLSMKKLMDKLTFFRIISYAGAVFSAVALMTSPLSTYASDAFSGITGHYRTWIGELSAIIFCINFCLYRKYSNEKKLVFFMLLNVITVLASGARGALLLIIIGVIYFVAIEKNLNKKLGYSLLGILVFIIVSFGVMRNDDLYYAFVTRVLGAINNDGSTQSVNERLFFIQSAIDLFMKHPILGCGVDSMRGYLTSIGYWHVTYSHCFYLELLSSYGIVGTMIFCFPIVRVMLNREKDSMTKYVLPIMLIGFIWSVEYYSYIFVFLIAQLAFYKIE